MSEQELIQKYFSRHQSFCETVDVSVGDDAAIVNPPENSKLVITTDTLNEGVHFYLDCKPQYIGHKSLSVSLSDIAAMGAKPLWATLSLSLPTVDHDWLKGFSDGLFALADTHKLKVVGGDLVKGPLSITIQVIGSIYNDQKLLRNTCQIDDLIYVTGYIGDAALGLKLINNDSKLDLTDSNQEYFLQRLQMPMPRLDVSAHIAEYAHAAIDISDGFLIDLQRLLAMSNKGAEIELENIPVSDAMKDKINQLNDIKNLLVGGEDYELLFTINPNDKTKLETHFKKENIVVTEVGRIVEGFGVSLLSNHKHTDLPNIAGFDHFS